MDTAYDKLKVAELRSRLVDRGIPNPGLLKPGLIAALKQADQDSAEEAEKRTALEEDEESTALEEQGQGQAAAKTPDPFMTPKHENGSSPASAEDFTVKRAERFTSPAAPGGWNSDRDGKEERRQRVLEKLYESKSKHHWASPQPVSSSTSDDSGCALKVKWTMTAAVLILLLLLVMWLCIDCLRDDGERTSGADGTVAAAASAARASWGCDDQESQSANDRPVVGWC